MIAEPLTSQALESARVSIDRFVSRFGERYREFLYYAAFPLFLTPDLLAFLRSRFLRATVPWLAEADLLLSPLCREIGYEQFALEPGVRAYMLRQAREHLPMSRQEEVADLLLQYVAEISGSSNVGSDLLTSQQWAAMAYLRTARQDVVRRLAGAFRDTLTPAGVLATGDQVSPSIAGIARLARITQEIAPELKDYPELVDYARQVAERIATSRKQPDQGLNRVPESDRPVEILGIALPPPSVLTGGAVPETRSLGLDRAVRLIRAMLRRAPESRRIARWPRSNPVGGDQVLFVDGLASSSESADHWISAAEAIFREAGVQALATGFSYRLAGYGYDRLDTTDRLDALVSRFVEQLTRADSTVLPVGFSLGAVVVILGTAEYLKSQINRAPIPGVVLVSPLLPSPGLTSLTRALMEESFTSIPAVFTELALPGAVEGRLSNAGARLASAGVDAHIVFTSSDRLSDASTIRRYLPTARLHSVPVEGRDAGRARDLWSFHLRTQSDTAILRRVVSIITPYLRQRAQPRHPERRRLKVFLAHASEDKDAVRTLYGWLRQVGAEPWLDEENLVPGNDWIEEVRRALQTTDVAAICLSRASLRRTGFVQSEIKVALDRLESEYDKGFRVIPVRLDDSKIPSGLRAWQSVDLFRPDAYEKFLSALQHVARSRDRVELKAVDPAPRPSEPQPQYAGPSRLGDILAQMGISYVELAQLSGLSSKTVSELARGKRQGSPKTWRQILRGLNTHPAARLQHEQYSLDDLLGPEWESHFPEDRPRELGAGQWDTEVQLTIKLPSTLLHRVQIQCAATLSTLKSFTLSALEEKIGEEAGSISSKSERETVDLKQSRITVRVPGDLHRRLSVHAALTRTSMRDLTVAALEEKLSRDEERRQEVVLPRLTWDSPPEMEIDPAARYVAHLWTTEGEIEVELFVDEVPQTVNNFVFLARQGFYDGVIFHRVIEGFMVQTGDRTGSGRGGPGYTFSDEPVRRRYTRGIVAMANAGPDTNGSQFFIVHGDDVGLPPNYTIFGRVTAGLDVVDKIALAPTRAGGEGSRPVKPPRIESVLIDEVRGQA